jgi:hypothetical protein
MTLTEIAGLMEHAVTSNRNHTATWLLPRGLSLLLVDMNGKRYLRLTRANVAPSEMEVDICRGAFHVPESAERTEGTGGRPSRCWVQMRWMAEQDAPAETVERGSDAS